MLRRSREPRLCRKTAPRNSQVQSVSKAMFETFLPSFKLKGLQITNFTATPNRTANSVTTAADSNLHSIFGDLAGSNPLLKFPTKSTVVYRADKVELALVVDVTGSMNQVRARRQQDQDPVAEGGGKRGHRRAHGRQPERYCGADRGCAVLGFRQRRRPGECD